MTEIAVALFALTSVWAFDLYRLREVLIRQERELDESVRKLNDERRTAQLREGIYR